MKKLVISTDFIELKSALKLLSFVESGGEVKSFLLENDVYVNGIKETRRGKKLYKGDKLKILNDEFEIDSEN